jgi:adenylate cyclase
VRCARDVIEGADGEGDPTALAAAAHGLAYLGRDYDTGLAAADRALALAPNSALVPLNAGWIRAYVGDSRTAVALLERAMRLSPVDPAMFLFTTALGFAHYTGGRYEDAAEWAGRALRDRPAYLAARRLLATGLAEVGRLDAAREAVRALLAVAPGYTELPP